MAITFDGPLDSGVSPTLSTLGWVLGGSLRAATSVSFPSSNVLRYVYNIVGGATGLPPGSVYTASPAWLEGSGGGAVAPWVGLT